MNDSRCSTPGQRLQDADTSAGASADVPAKQRECAACQACCGPTLQINDPLLVVAKSETCRHLCDRGCSVWDKPAMPHVCRTYTCNYLAEPEPLTIAERPDRVGAIVQRTNSDGTLLAEYRPGGLQRTLRNHFWGPRILQDLRRGDPLIVTFLEDPHGAETLRARLERGRLSCALAACDEHGVPVLVPLEPVFERSLQAALFVAPGTYPFEAGLLVRYLGQRERAVLEFSRAGDDVSRVRFSVTRRQAAVLRTLLALL